MEIARETYDQIAKLIHSDDSPVGIDAKRTHIYIIHLLQQMEKRLGELETRIDSLGQGADRSVGT